MDTDFIFPPIATGVLLVVTALLADRASERWRPFCWAIFICLVAVVVGFDIHEKVSNHSEAEKLNGRIDKLGGELQQSETKRELDTAVLSTKLSDYAQFGPAIMKLATVSAEFQKKQYEQKVLADHDLYDTTMKLVTKIRDFQKKHEEASERISLVGRVDLKNMSDEERHQAWTEQTNKLIQENFNEQSEFQAMMPEVLYVRGLLLARKLPEPQLSQPLQSMANTALSSGFANSFSENALATYLELMVKPLANR